MCCNTLMNCGTWKLAQPPSFHPTFMRTVMAMAMGPADMAHMAGETKEVPCASRGSRVPVALAKMFDMFGSAAGWPTRNWLHPQTSAHDSIYPLFLSATHATTWSQDTHISVYWHLTKMIAFTGILPKWDHKNPNKNVSTCGDIHLGLVNFGSN